MDEKNDDFVLQGTFYNAPEGPTGVSLILNNGCFLQRQNMQIGTHCFLINQAFVGSVGSASGTERPTVLGGGGRGGCGWAGKSGARTLLPALNSPAAAMPVVLCTEPHHVHQGFCSARPFLWATYRTPTKEQLGKTVCG